MCAKCLKWFCHQSNFGMDDELESIQSNFDGTSDMRYSTYAFGGVILICMRLCHYTSIWKHADVFFPWCINKYSLHIAMNENRLKISRVKSTSKLACQWNGSEGIKALFKCIRKMPRVRKEGGKLNVKFKYRLGTERRNGRRGKIDWNWNIHPRSKKHIRCGLGVVWPISCLFTTRKWILTVEKMSYLNPSDFFLPSL